MANRLRRLAPIAVTGAAALVLAAAAADAFQLPAEAESAVHGPEPSATVVQRRGLSLQDAVAIAQQRFRGRVVSAQTVTVGGRAVHVIRIEDGERVRTVRIDAETGQIM